MDNQKESVKVLQECVELQLKKSRDYQNPNSNIVQSMHYRRGVSTIHDMIHQKVLRAQSLLEAAESSNGEVSANFESLEDTYKDLINYASFAVSYLREKMEGQDLSRDYLNRRKMTVSIDPNAPLVSGINHSALTAAEPAVLSRINNGALTAAEPAVLSGQQRN